MTDPTGATPGGRQPRFVGYDVLRQVDEWDAETSAVVQARLRPVGSARFFSETEEPTARALVDRLLAQDDEPRVPVFELIDARLLSNDGDGYRYADMPADPEAWHRSLGALDDESNALHHMAFHELDVEQQMALVEAVRLSEDLWHGLPAPRLFGLWMRYSCAAFYSHPWAWNEIGFGGPAYPRGYVNIGLDRRERWERPERDAADPIPWVERAEAARKAHAARLPARFAGTE
jgi:hypothetical protein